MPSVSIDPAAILGERFSRAIKSMLREAGSDASDPEYDSPVAASRKAELADYQCNAAMKLGKVLGRPPREVALEILSRVDAGEITEPLGPESVAGPGFINIRLRKDSLARLLAGMEGSDLGVARATRPQTVVVDLFGVNLAKQMHVGHLRSTIIGDALVRVLSRLGHKVIRQSHFGDWGLPIAMVVAMIIRENGAGRIDLESLTLDDLDRMYREARREGTADRAGLAAAKRTAHAKAIAELEEQVAGAEEVAAEARRTLVAMQSGDGEMYKVWRRIYDITLQEGLAVCGRLHTTITADDTAGESTYADELGPLVDDLLARGVAEISEGAVVVRVEGIIEPCLVRKRDGGFLYATTDLAAVRRRVQKFGADRVVYCIDAGQSLHLRLVFGASIKAGYATKPGVSAPSSLEHAAFGTVLGEDKRPFRTRSGENLRLAALLDEGVARAEKIVAEKSPNLSDVERRTVAEAVGIAAIKYADLSNDRVRDYVFSFDRMLAFEGNSGPYLLNALVRIKSIFRKAAERGVADAAGIGGHPFELDHPAEKGLALALLRYPGTVRSVGDSLEPHRMCNYLFELAGAFSGYYENCPVLTAEEGVMRSRLRLCRLTERVLEDGLTLMGLPVLQRM